MVNQEDHFSTVPNDVLVQILYYVDSGTLENFVARQVRGFWSYKNNPARRDLSDEQVQNFFLPLSTFHLINRNFLKSFMAYHNKLIENEVTSRNFPLQRLCFVPDKGSKKTVIAKFQKKQIKIFQNFIEEPSDFNVDTFLTLDPFFRVTYLDWQTFWYSQKQIEVEDSWSFVKLINDTIGYYRKTFEQATPGDFNLWMLVALALLEKGEQINYYFHRKFAENKLLLFFQFFFNSPLSQEVKRKLFVKFENMRFNFIQNAFQDYNSGHLFYSYLYSDNRCIQSATLSFFKKNLQSESQIRIREVQFFYISLYIRIFGIKDDCVIQENLKNSFNQFFEKNGLSKYQGAIDALITKKTSDFWPLYSMLYENVSDRDLIHFFQKYSLPNQLERLEMGYCYNPFLKELNDLLHGINSDNIDSFLTNLFQKHSFVPFFLHGHYRTNFESLDKIVSFIAQKTDCYHEDIAKKMGLNAYVVHYNKLISDLNIQNTHEISSNHTSDIMYSYQRVNPFYRFSDSKFFFEKFFSRKSKAVVLKKIDGFYSYKIDSVYATVQKKLIDNLRSKNNEFHNYFHPLLYFQTEKAVDIIKKIIQSDKGQSTSSNQVIQVHQNSSCWNVLSLPFIIIITEELKKLITADHNLMNDIEILKGALEKVDGNNWKMNGIYFDACSFLSEIKESAKKDPLATVPTKILSENNIPLLNGSGQNQKTDIDQEEQKPSAEPSVQTNNNLQITPRQHNQPARPLPNIQKPSGLKQKAINAIKQLWRSHALSTITCISIFSYISVKCIYKFYKNYC